MAPRLRSLTLETRTSRLRLKVRQKPYFVPVAPGIALGYRRNLGAGSWLVRCADGKGGSWSKGFATADDFEDADGAAILDFWQAQPRARELVRGKHTDARKPITVAEALEDKGRPGRPCAAPAEGSPTNSPRAPGRVADAARARALAQCPPDLRAIARHRDQGGQGVRGRPQLRGQP